ncbi:restriction endonuclease subunit S [Microcoleus sp. F4-D5]|uniref:restriction endonuclease subunit S n=1 Tax=Microcoleus sp. F4-D5 TaxID=2818760 RepID=UPI002FD12754
MMTFQVDTWQRVKLAEICDKITDGTHQPPSFNSEGIPFLFVRNIVSGQIDFNVEKYVSRETYEELTRRHRPLPGDLLFSAVGSFGVAVVVDTERAFTFQRHIALLKPKTNQIDSYFLALYLNSPEGRQQSEIAATGGSQRTVTLQALAEFVIPLPPLAEQKRIAAIAQKADRLRRTRRYALQLSDTYLRSVFLEMFGDPIANPKGWEIVKLSSLGELDRGRSKHRPRNAPKLFGGSYPFIQTGDVANSAGYIRTYKQTYSELGLKQSKLWTKGTLCITIAANIAKTGILTFDACFPDSIVGFSPNYKTNTEVIQQWFNFIQQNLEETAPESAQKNINLEILRNLDLPIPPLPLQEKFAQIAQKFDRLRTQQQEADRQAEHLFQTILHRAFRGELTPQNADDEPESVLLEEIRAQQAKAKAATQAMGDAADYLGTKAKQQDIEPIQLKFPGFE